MESIPNPLFNPATESPNNLSELHDIVNSEIQDEEEKKESPPPRRLSALSILVENMATKMKKNIT
jgi:hypothetical protein